MTNSELNPQDINFLWKEYNLPAQQIKNKEGEKKANPCNFRETLISVLEQEEIKKCPKINNEEKTEEETSPEIQDQIKEIFWEENNEFTC